MMRALWAVALFAALGAYACGDDDDSPTNGDASGTPASETAVPSPTPEWRTYTDAVSGYTLPIPGDVSAIESTNEFQLESGERGESRILAFTDTAGSLLFAFSASVNPEGKTLREWITVYPEILAEPEEISVDGADGFLYEEPHPDDTDVTVYWLVDDTIYAIRGSTGDVVGDAMAEPLFGREDFQKLIDGIEAG